jgi:hypothetical protein
MRDVVAAHEANLLPHPLNFIPELGIWGLQLIFLGLGFLHNLGFLL